ncbi:MAG: carotenoid oxygenase family protein, partial [Cyanobacteria bacterium J06641_5]
GITKDYILVADVAFKFALEDFLPTTTQSPILQSLTRAIAPFLTYAQMWYLPLYIVPRAQLETVRPDNPIAVKQVKIRGLNLNPKTLFEPGAAVNPEAAHYLTDYENPEDRITIHAAHAIATDPSEYIRKTDKYFADGPQPLTWLGRILSPFRALFNRRSTPVPDDPAAQKMTEALRERAGMIVSPMDANRLGSWTIDAKAGKVLSRALSAKDGKDKNGISQRVWYPAIYAWRGSQQCGDYSPSQFTDIYWLDYGVWPQLASCAIYQMYDKHKNRVVERQEMRGVLAEGRPAALVRSQIKRDEAGIARAVEIVDRYEFPRNFFSSTPQFIPRKDSKDPTDGYLVCIVLWGDIENKQNQFWIFDAADLQAGPRYRLQDREKKLNIGLTIHSTWMASLGVPPARANYSAREDYEHMVLDLEARFSPEVFEQVKELFDRYVYREPS